MFELNFLSESAAAVPALLATCAGYQLALLLGSTFGCGRNREC